MGRTATPGDGGTTEAGGADEEVDGPDGGAAGTASQQHGGGIPWWIAAALAALALAAGFLLGRPSTPLDTSADAGFLRDMSAHHAQAVDMSMIILEKTEEQRLRTAAVDIARTQQAQIGIMQGWLTQWDLNSRGSEPPMAWMEGHDHGHGGGSETPERMPGLATPEEMEELQEAEGTEAEILFLELMIEHHVGGIEMAQAAVSLGGEELVTDLAAGMARGQQAEIALMESMLAERGVETD